MKAHMFRTMPPRHHDRVDQDSAVLAFIIQTLECDLEQAKRTFRYLRNKRHLVFDSRGRWWRGAEFVPDETPEQRTARMQGEINDARSRIRTLERQVEDLIQTNNKLVAFAKKHKT